MRTGKIQLALRVGAINRLHMLNLTIDWQMGQPRIESKGRFISPRLPKSAMMTWLEGFESGLEVKDGRL